jgi:hypothetical protein
MEKQIQTLKKFLKSSGLGYQIDDFNQIAFKRTQRTIVCYSIIGFDDFYFFEGQNIKFTNDFNEYQRCLTTPHSNLAFN